MNAFFVIFCRVDVDEIKISTNADLAHGAFPISHIKWTLGFIAYVRRISPGIEIYLGYSAKFNRCLMGFSQDTSLISDSAWM
jgi:hypothetical protein